MRFFPHLGRILPTNGGKRQPSKKIMDSQRRYDYLENFQMLLARLEEKMAIAEVIGKCSKHR